MKATGWASWMCAVALVAGCGSEVVLVGASPSKGGATAVDPRPSCSDPPARLSLANATSGAFVGQRLHLFAELDGVARYVVLGLDERGAWLVGLPHLTGPANLAELRPGLSARLSGGGAGGYHADAVDTSDPDAPKLRATLPLDGIVDEPFASAFGTDPDHLLFCSREPDGERYLHAVDLSDPDAPELHGVSGNPCDAAINRDAAAASGSVWMVWGENSAENAGAEVFQANADGAVKLGDYHYAPDGIHAYGNVLHAATDGSLAVFDPSNDSEFFLFELAPGGGAAKFNHAYLGAGGPKRLLDVRGGVIYLATPKGVRAYRVESFHEWSGEWASVTLLDYQADIALGDELATPIAGSDSLLVIGDAAGAVYAVPRHRSGPVAPLAVFDGEPCP